MPKTVKVDRLNAPSGAECFLTPASGSGVVAPLPGGRSATGSASTPRDRPAQPQFNHLSASWHQALLTPPRAPPVTNFQRRQAKRSTFSPVTLDTSCFRCRSVRTSGSLGESSRRSTGDGLDAAGGAERFLTRSHAVDRNCDRLVSMHLLVLDTFW